MPLLLNTLENCKDKTVLSDNYYLGYCYYTGKVGRRDLGTSPTPLQSRQRVWKREALGPIWRIVVIVPRPSHLAHSLTSKSLTISAVTRLEHSSQCASIVSFLASQVPKNSRQRAHSHPRPVCTYGFDQEAGKGKAISWYGCSASR
jgi:hypothetical protein